MISLITISVILVSVYTSSAADTIYTLEHVDLIWPSSIRTVLSSYQTNMLSLGPESTWSISKHVKVAFR